MRPYLLATVPTPDKDCEVVVLGVAERATAGLSPQ